ncbi:unnamed protein product [Psylliodes chrysocephalus]|uniref:Uncharacterized protein n=1 Tax=Psylliodes chrysocephalus TaxID=3402493 RepID=A0A9P0CUC4_9CUCU|nr:unnamed protein product [Psylliodes chrysocephala]
MMSSDEEEPFMSSGSEYVPSDSDQPSTSRGKTRKIKKQTKKRKKLENTPLNNPNLTPVVNRPSLPANVSTPCRKKGKKRIRNEALWQRNIRKVRMAKGEAYTTVKSGKLLPERKVGNDCGCRRKCFSKISTEKRNQVLQDSNGLASKEKQDLYLGGLIRVDKVARKRLRTGTGKAKTVTFHYKVG